MYRLEFENEYAERRLVGKFETVEEANAAMVKELHSKGIKPYYFRSWGYLDKKGQTIDYGSHSCFYHIIKED